MLQQEEMTTIDFQESELTEQVGQTARDFAEQHIRPYVMKWDESQEFPLEVFKEMGKLGLMGVLIPEAYGGAGLGYVEYVKVISEIARVCGSIGLSLAAHNSLCSGHIMAFANESQKSRWPLQNSRGENMTALPSTATARKIVARRNIPPKQQ